MYDRKSVESRVKMVWALVGLTGIIPQSQSPSCEEDRDCLILVIFIW